MAKICAFLRCKQVEVWLDGLTAAFTGIVWVIFPFILIWALAGLFGKSPELFRSPDLMLMSSVLFGEHSVMHAGSSESEARAWRIVGVVGFSFSISLVVIYFLETYVRGCSILALVDQGMLSNISTVLVGASPIYAISVRMKGSKSRAGAQAPSVP